MPVNLFEIQKSLPDFAQQAKAHSEAEQKYLAVLEKVLAANAGRLDEIEAALEREKGQNERLRCAEPTGEALNEAFPAGKMPALVSLLAADGSQINPSRHARVPFCVINIGAVEMVRGSGLKPKVYQESLLLDYDRTTLPETGIINEGAVALRRDFTERQRLATWSANLVKPAIAMIDGPLELYRDAQQTAEFKQIAEKFQATLDQFFTDRVFLLGYVDKPGSDLFVNLVEFLGRGQVEFADEFSASRPVRVADTDLFRTILKNPGDRSAVFKVLSPTSESFGLAQQVHFFYMNVGTSKFQHLARVEVPAWVAGDRDNITLIQAAIMDQTRIMGSKPYPYLLHRAHEVAVVSMAEHQQVEDMIIATFYNSNVPIGAPSQKQAAKGLMKNGGK
ncbi:DNA double-strand break repair nuclease NurA [Chloroflexota bacterium]|nr:DNA double-strand break repair nuclease NurA [Chloroflexota bacterium]